jgi:membrane-bound serine protease (ClpP class)
MNKRLTLTRLALAVVSMALEQVAIWLIWRWVLPEFGVELPFSVLIGIMAAWAVLGTWLFIFTTRTLEKQAPAGRPSMVGTTGKVTTKLAPKGMVRIRGELWSARSIEGDINAGEDIVVTSEERMKLLVRKAGDSEATH